MNWKGNKCEIVSELGDMAVIRLEDGTVCGVARQEIEEKKAEPKKTETKKTAPKKRG